MGKLCLFSHILIQRYVFCFCKKNKKSSMYFMRTIYDTLWGDDITISLISIFIRTGQEMPSSHKLIAYNSLPFSKSFVFYCVRKLSMSMSKLYFQSQWFWFTVKFDIFTRVIFRVWQSKRNLACFKFHVCAGQCFYYEHYCLRVFNFSPVLWCVKCAKISTFTECKIDCIYFLMLFSSGTLIDTFPLNYCQVKLTYLVVTYNVVELKESLYRTMQIKIWFILYV